MLGRKILATGTVGAKPALEGLRRERPSLVRHAFEHLSPAQTVELFEELGVLAEKSEGRSIPTGAGLAAADALQSALEETVVIRLKGK